MTRSTPQEDGPRCRSCRVPLKAYPKRCPHCGSFLDWRQHITLVNVLGASMVLLLLVSAFAVYPVIRAMSEHRSVVRMKPVLFAKGGMLTEQLDFANDGDRPYVVVVIKVRFVNSEGEEVVRLMDGRDWGRPLTVDGHGANVQAIDLAQCPGKVSRPQTIVTIRNFDGSLQEVEYQDTAAMVSCTSSLVPKSP